MTIRDDIKTPLGSNNLTSLGLFYWRDLYKKYLAPTNNTIDIWYEDMLYGRVDHNSVPIYPSENSLKELTSDKTILAINFVSDAWEDMRRYVRESVLEGSISKDSIYSAMEPQLGWVSIHAMYHEWNNLMYGAFSQSFINPARNQKITNFKEFLYVYLEYIDKMSYVFPQTRESLILSSHCSPRISGLIIEIAEAPHDLDIAKLLFLNDSSFDRITKIAKKFGFKIDKNAPWRFVADLESKNMQAYMFDYEMENEKNVYDIHYFKSYEYELEIFKHYVWGWYNQFATGDPTVSKVIVKNNFIKNELYGGCNTSKLYVREIISEEDAFRRYSDSFWLRMYVYVRAKETRKKWTQATFDKVVKKVLDLNRIKNRDTAMRYLHSKLRSFQKSRFNVENTFTEEEIDDILKERSLKRHHGNFKF